ncbi:helix-turn-helix domain-containing protein [Streptomyces zaomyceticus]|uniref:helix-turn-helix domain-containing protein n=1 Tax=Streptomyces zaomyceticus TaxID=68286 RepID=UPI002E23D71C
MPEQIKWPEPRKPLRPGAARDRLLAQVRERYNAGASIRDLVKESKRSYGFVRGLLVASGVSLRPPRGGGRPSPR